MTRAPRSDKVQPQPAESSMINEGPSHAGVNGELAAAAPSPSAAAVAAPPAASGRSAAAGTGAAARAAGADGDGRWRRFAFAAYALHLFTVFGLALSNIFLGLTL